MRDSHGRICFGYDMRHDDLLDKILDGEPFMMVITPDIRRALRRRMCERAHEGRNR